MSGPALRGRRVMIVEDDLLVAMLIEDILAEQGCHVIGPFGTLAGALQAAAETELDLAVLDMNLHGERAYPVAELLADRRVPFLMVTGYGEDALPKDRPDWRAMAKPFRNEQLVRALAGCVAPE